MTNSETVESKQVGDKSPFAGCAIFMTVLLVLVFLISFSVFVLFQQFNHISKFTEEKPVKVRVDPLENRETELNELAQKIERFRILVMDGKSAVLELNPNELNLAIATYDALKDLRGDLRVSEITNEQIKFDISFELNGKPRLGRKGESGLVTSDPRYLNGVMITKPALLNKEVVLRVQDIVANHANVPTDFIEGFSPYRIASKYVGDTEIGIVMSEITNVELGDGVIRFVKEEGKIPKDTFTNEQVDKSSQRLFKFLGIAASIFLFFAAVIIFVGMRAKKRREILGDSDESA
jgi:hypothetical protein